LDLVGFVAQREEDEGKQFADALVDWYEDRPISPGVEKLPVMPADGGVLREMWDVQMVLSALPSSLSRQLDTQLAATGMPVVSESPGLRDEPDIPLITPEINPEHLKLIPIQQGGRGWDRGFIVANPACTITILALPLKPILDAFGIERVLIVTLQAMSGAGPSGIPGMGIVDNLVPYIKLEEEKLSSEGRKILGDLEDGRVSAANFEISSTCTRLPITDGHTGAVFVQCSRSVTVDQAAEAMAAFRGLPQELGLPSAPEMPIIVTDVQDRPQPRLDRGIGDGKVVTVGRIRLDQALPNGIKFVVTGHNRRRGTFGNTLLNAELLVAQGLVP
jgi:aspartate-semialdehyde dehydrogenase